MTLDPRSTFPSSLHYVLKLHRDTPPGRDRFHGRAEHLASGRHVEFDSAQGLVAWLLQDIATLSATPEEPA